MLRPCCRSKLVHNLLLKVYQSLTNLLQNLITSSKNNTFAIPSKYVMGKVAPLYFKRLMKYVVFLGDKGTNSPPIYY